MRKRIKSRLWGVLMSIVVASFFVLPSFAAEQIKLTVWTGSAREVVRGLDAILTDYEKAHPEVKLVVQIQPDVCGGLTEKSATKFMIAIASGRAPDVVELNGPTIKGWASRNSLTPLTMLDDLTERSKIYDNYPSCILEEHSYQGKVYAIPAIYAAGGDYWGFIWNKGIFKENGLDPNRAPKNWDEILTFAKKLAKLDNLGNIRVLGYHPIPKPNDRAPDFINIAYGNGWESMSEDRKTVLLNDPSVVETLEWIVKVLDAQGGMKKIGAFEGGFKPGSQDPFLQEQIAMVDFHLGYRIMTIGKYRPEMEFGVAFHPVKEGRPLKNVTWNGGCWVWAMPSGSKYPEKAWEFMVETSTPEAIAKAGTIEGAFIESVGGYWVPSESIGNAAAAKIIAETYLPNLKEKASADVYEAVRDYIFYLPEKADKILANYPTPIFAEYWAETHRAVENAIRHKMSPKESLDASTKKIQKKLDDFYKEHE